MFLPPQEGAVSSEYSVNSVHLNDKGNQYFCAWQHSKQVLSLESLWRVLLLLMCQRKYFSRPNHLAKFCS